MTDNEIIRALECCIKGKCITKNCPLKGTEDISSRCVSKLMQYALDLINRQQADNEKLNVELKAMRGAANSYKAEIERLKGIIGKDILIANVRGCGKTEAVKAKIHLRMGEVKKQARREFAERLKGKYAHHRLDSEISLDAFVCDIKHLLKEMEKDGGTEAN